jgi:hypothetical protein
MNVRNTLKLRVIVFTKGFSCMIYSANFSLLSDGFNRLKEINGTRNGKSLILMGVVFSSCKASERKNYRM